MTSMEPLSRLQFSELAFIATLLCKLSASARLRALPSPPSMLIMSYLLPQQISYVGSEAENG